MQKLSIITINRDNADGLRKTMESVFTQTYSDFEYIVIDGASTDESVKIIREFESQNQSYAHPLSFIWLSEPDAGIYQAMNKGLRMAHGEYTLMLNSGDYLAEKDVVERVIPELHTDDMIQGSMYLHQKDLQHLDYGNGLTKMSFFDVYQADFLHQAIFIRKDVHDKYGYYDESYRIAGDTAFFIKVLGFRDVSFRFVDIPISLFAGGGIASSKDPEMLSKRHMEYKRIEQEILGPRITNICRKEYKKIQMYDLLHAHRWSWILTSALVWLCKLFCRNK